MMTLSGNKPESSQGERLQIVDTTLLRPMPPKSFAELVGQKAEERNAATDSSIYSRYLQSTRAPFSLASIMQQTPPEPTPRSLLQVVSTFEPMVKLTQPSFAALKGKTFQFDGVLTKAEAVNYAQYLARHNPEICVFEGVVFDECAECNISKVRRAPLSLFDTPADDGCSRRPCWPTLQPSPVEGDFPFRIPSSLQNNHHLVFPHVSKAEFQILPKSSPVLEPPEHRVACEPFLVSRALSEFGQSCDKSVCNMCFFHRHFGKGDDDDG